MVKHLIKKTSRSFKRLLSDTSGNFAMMFGICGTALILCAAGSIDVMGMQKQKSHLQFLTDSGALAAASLRSDKFADIKKAAEAAVAANNNTELPLNVKVTLEGDTIRVEAESDYDAQLMGIFGMDNIPVNSVSEAPVPEENPVNIALVLDSTGSMAGANMDALKSASKKLLDVFSEAEPGNIQAGVVPYNKWVNVGLANRNRSWMDVDNDSSTTGTEVCYMTKPLVDSSLCTTTTTTSTCRNDSGEYACDKTSRTCPPEAYGAEYEYCYTPTSTQTWNGCVTSREDPFQFEPAYKGKKFKGVMNVSCGSEILDLTTNLNDVGNHIDALSASGNTYIPAGLIWGWRMLEPSQPFGGLTNAETQRKRALVLMTDGTNTVYNDVNSNHADAVRPEEIDKANAYTKQICDNLKDTNIDVYTVVYRLGAGDKDVFKLIKDCASSPSFFFPANNAEDLEKAFEEIAESLFEIRLSR